MQEFVRLPPITVTSEDYDRLEKIAPAFASQLPDFGITLIDELDRATIVDGACVSPSIVTMNSHVEFEFSGKNTNRRTVVLVYPGEQDISVGKISVHTPVGTALLGLAEGHSIEWETRSSGPKRLTVLRVIDQPEANARSLRGYDGEPTKIRIRFWTHKFAAKFELKRLRRQRGSYARACRIALRYA